MNFILALRYWPLRWCRCDDTKCLPANDFINFLSLNKMGWWMTFMFYMYMKLWKESLNSDVQQFHQYQQNKQSPLTSNHWTQKETTLRGWKSRSWFETDM